MKEKRTASNFRLTETSRVLLRKLSSELGICKTGVLELLVRREAKAMGLRCEEPRETEKETLNHG
jgi:hypothetical protein